MAPPEVDPLIGQVLSGRFEIVAPLGIGGMGRVYKAIQRPLGREVALKVLNPRYDGVRDPGFERRFFLEASMTAKLKHPNTITVHDYGRTDDGVFFIAMELLEGETLQKVLVDQGRLPWARAMNIGGQVARSLREAHKLGLVHRDLKPANVMLTPEGTSGDTVKVLDFGLVKSFTPDKPKVDDPERTGLTQAGVLLGSPLYMAPEQARGEADPRSDIYALGVLLFQSIAGRPPFEAKESIDVIVKHIREPAPRLSSFVPEVPAAVEGVVMRCLEKEPLARFQSMDELLEALRAAMVDTGYSGAFVDPRLTRSLSTTTLATPGGELIRSVEIELESSLPGVTPAKRAPWALAGVVALLLALAGVAIVVSRAQPAPPPPAPARVAAPVQPVIAPAAVVELPKEVRFDVNSTPPGATVSRAGAELGVTPFSFSLPAQDAGEVQVELAFSLPGYDPASVVAHGVGSVTVSAALSPTPPAPTPAEPTPVKVRRPKPKRPSSENGFKDDPY